VDLGFDDSQQAMSAAASRGLPKDKREKKGKKGKKPPPRQLYYGLEERPDKRGTVPLGTLGRRLRTANGAGENANVVWCTKPEHRPVLQYDSLSIIDISVQRMPAPQSDAEREEGFNKHWAFRPKLQHPPFKQSTEEMRPFIERMLANITERQRKERLEREAELARQKAAKKKKGGGKKKKGGREAENKSGNPNRV